MGAVTYAMPGGIYLKAAQNLWWSMQRSKYKWQGSSSWVTNYTETTLPNVPIPGELLGPQDKVLGSSLPQCLRMIATAALLKVSISCLYQTFWQDWKSLVNWKSKSLFWLLFPGLPQLTKNRGPPYLATTALHNSCCSGSFCVQVPSWDEELQPDRDSRALQQDKKRPQ